MKKHRLIGLAALLALATGCGKDVADRISLFANSMGGGAKVWMDPDPTDVNGATWVAGEEINLNGRPYAITANGNSRFSLEVEPLAEAMYAVYPATMNSDGNDIEVVNNNASGATITIKSLAVDFRDGGHRIVFPMAAQAAAESGSLFFDHLTAGLRLTLENSTNSGYAIDHLKVVVQGTAAAGDVEIGGVSYTVAWAVQGPTTPSGDIGGIEDDRSVGYSSEMNFRMQTNGVAGVTVPAKDGGVNGSISFCVPVTVCELQRISITGYDASGVQLFTKSKSIDSDRPNLEVNHMYHIPAIEIN
jgi:hypothetical protein